MNSVVAALRFFFTHTLDRPDLSRRLYREKVVRKLPVVLSRCKRPPSGVLRHFGSALMDLR